MLDKLFFSLYSRTSTHRYSTTHSPTDSIKIDIPTQQSSSSDESCAANTPMESANFRTEDNYQSELDDLEELTLMDIMNPGLKQAIDNLCKTTVTSNTESKCKV